MRYPPFRLAFSCLLAISIIVAPAAAQPGTLERGKYLVTLGDCEVCHTANKGGAQPFAGGFPLHATFGTVYSTNITPDKDTGIGNWTEDDFFRALHHGLDKQGNHLYPAFPYPYFQNITRADSDAILAYLHTLAPVHQPPRQNKLMFPTNIRWLMTFWNWLFTPQSEFKPDPSQSKAWNRGGQLVHGIAHCGGCHSPKNFFFSDEPGRLLQGATVDAWHAPNLTGSPNTGLGKWSVADVEQFLKTGKTRFNWVVGSMRDVVRVSTSQWSDADRHAVAVYLKSLPATPEKTPPKPDAAAMQDGQTIYAARCAVCHDRHNGDYPSLAKNSVVSEADPTTVLRVILEGSQSPAIPGRPRDFSMPSFAALSDKQLAAVATYIRNSMGNHAGGVSQSDAHDLRSQLASWQ
jgi:mono/diheme cytochrome c family protein